MAGDRVRRDAVTLDRGTYAIGVLTIALRASKPDPDHPGDTVRDRARRILDAEGASFGLTPPDRAPVIDLAFASSVLRPIVERLQWHAGACGSTGEAALSDAARAYAYGNLWLSLDAALSDPAHPGEPLIEHVKRLVDAEGWAWGVGRRDHSLMNELARFFVLRRDAAARLRRGMMDLNRPPRMGAATAPALPVAPPVHTLTRHRGRRA